MGSPGFARMVCADCQVMRRNTTVMTRPISGSPTSNPSATTAALATTDRLTRPSARA
jgi:hypothetical protein